MFFSSIISIHRLWKRNDYFGVIRLEAAFTVRLELPIFQFLHDMISDVVILIDNSLSSKSVLQNMKTAEQ